MPQEIAKTASFSPIHRSALPIFTRVRGYATRIADRLAKCLFRFNLQSRLVIGFVIATCLTGSVANLIGVWSINKSTMEEVHNRVRQDINTAKLIYDQTLALIASQVQSAAETTDLNRMIVNNDLSKLDNLSNLIRQEHGVRTKDSYMLLDIISVVDASGNVLYRAANPEVKGDSMLWSPIVKKCIEEKIPLSSTELVNIKDIMRENPNLVDQVRINIIETPHSFEPKEKELSDGMVMMAACPLFDAKKRLQGAIIGGLLLNKDDIIVDKIRETLYQGEKYKGRDMGVATIFYGGVRIATNVMTRADKRAIGTTLSKEVYNKVIVEGKDWVGRAFVVDSWYIATYTTLYDINKNLIGILYVGLLDAKYRDIMWHTIWINLGITSLGTIVAFIISFRLGNTIITRIRLLKAAAEAIAAGNLDHQLSPDRISGFDMLDEAFNYMSKSLKDHDEKLRNAYTLLARTEKLTALGKMAAGVAHEINNPLGGILLYSNLILEDLPEGSSTHENARKIIQQTIRCKEIVQNLLDFSRIHTRDMGPLKINDVINTCLNLVKDQSMFHGIEVETRFAEMVPEVIGDRDRLEDVFLNLFINAADAMKGNGKLTITSKLDLDDSVKILVTDTGEGIGEEHLPHIFEPFFTTKEPGKGTGLGLSIAYGTVRKHGGLIDVESSPGKGTTFIISLPTHAIGIRQPGDTCSGNG
jgi:two-component system NtrC family sensor kinase